jgi:hypothetical protein
MTSRVAKMKAKMAATPNEVSLMELETFQCFKRLLKEDDKIMLGEWMMITLKRVVVSQGTSCLGIVALGDRSGQEGSEEAGGSPQGWHHACLL